jgi:hypothetical protein
LDEGNTGWQIPLAWIGAEELPVLFVNQFVAQVDEGGEFFLTLGQTMPPALIGTPEERAEQLEQIAYVPVKPVARLALTERGCRDLIANLQNVRESFEQLRRMRGDNQP